MPPVDFKRVEYTVPVVEYGNLRIFKPRLPIGVDWSYLGPCAITVIGVPPQDQNGVIVRALDDPEALADVEDWVPVFIDIEEQKYSIWRGVAPEGYVVIGNFFVTGIEKPTPEQTAGIQAIRADIPVDLPVNHHIWGSLWDRDPAPKHYVRTGAFVHVDEGSTGVQIGLLIEGAW